MTLNQPILPDFVFPCLPNRPHETYHTYHCAQLAASSILQLTDSKNTLSSATTTTNAPEEDPMERELIDVLSEGDLPRLQELLKEKQNGGSDWDVNSLTGTGLTPIHYAAARGHLSVLRFLVEDANAVTDPVDREGETPLLKAAYNGHADIIQFLLAKDANIHHRDHDGWSALHNAASRGHLLAARALIDGGADVNAQSKTGHTPLMSASAKGFVDLVELLLSNKSDPLLKTIFGDTAYDLAAQAEEAYICEILIFSEQDAVERLVRQGVKVPLIVPHNAVVEVLHENQRSGLFSRQFSADNLSKNDIRGPWSTPAGRPCSLEEVHLPIQRDKGTGQLVRGWFWLTDWRIAENYPRVDSEGWQYARAFEEPDAQWTSSPVGSALSVNGLVRRRRWIRVRKRRVDMANETSQTDSSIENNDYVAAAEALISTASTNSIDANPLALREELTVYEAAIQTLLEGIKKETVADRKKTVAAMISSYLAHAERLHAMVGEDDGEDGNIVETPPLEATDNKGKEPEISTDERDVNQSETGGGETAEVPRATTHPSSNAILSDDGPASTRGPINPLAGSAPPIMSPPSSWQPDSEAISCAQCQRRFTLWLRRHHCRWCGRIYCAACTSSRATLVPNTPPNRVCDTCYAYLLGCNTHNERTLPDMPTSTVEPPSPSRSNYSAAESIMNECPVCQQPLNPQTMMEDEMEQHVADCLDKIATRRGEDQLISGNRYVVQVLKEDLPGRECVICLENFLQGQRIARLNCLCLYHESCIEAWFTNPTYGARACPVHYK